MSSVCYRCDADEVGAAPPRFVADIWPHLSLSRRGFRLVSCIVVGAAAIMAVAAATWAVWPIAGFAVADAFFLVAAMAAARRSQRRLETITVADGHVLIEHKIVGHSIDREILPVFGLRLRRTDDNEFGCLSLAIVSCGRVIAIARDLSPAERDDFAAALDAAVTAHGGLGLGTPRRSASPCAGAAIGYEHGTRP